MQIFAQANKKQVRLWSKMGFIVLPTLFVAAALVPTRAQTPPASGANTAVRVADLLDGLLQTRFAQAEKPFGISRIVPMVRGHVAVGQFRPQNDTEKQTFSQIEGFNQPYDVYFLHTTPTPYEKANPAFGFRLNHLMRGGTPTPTGYPTSAQNDLLRKDALAALPRLKQGSDVRLDRQNETVFLRPVRASGPACLSCHTTAKSGDTLGVLVYAVNKVTAKSATAAR